MIDLFDQPLSRHELMRRIGDLSQIAGVEMATLAEGRAKGVLAARIRTGTGFIFTVLPDRGLDIASAEFAGIPLAWRSLSREVHPAYFDGHGIGWLKSFFGGLLTTCGLAHAGEPCHDGEDLGLHGRISNTPAHEITSGGAWDGDDYVMTVSGKVREAEIDGHSLELTRRITSRLGASSLTIEDTVENIGFRPQPHHILYHCNIGYPIVSEHSRLLYSADRIDPRNDVAAAGLADFNRMTAPQPDYQEQCFYYSMVAAEDGMARVAIFNPRLDGGRGLGIYIAYRHETLPEFINWKMMGEGEYVMGLEPASARIPGRDVLRREGKLKILQPGEKIDYWLEIGVLRSREAVRQFEESLEARQPEHSFQSR